MFLHGSCPDAESARHLHLSIRRSHASKMFELCILSRSSRFIGADKRRNGPGGRPELTSSHDRSRQPCPHSLAMHLTRPLQAGALALALGTAAAAPLLAPALSASDRLPKPSLETFRQTEATTFEDYAGRAVLIEFFEHW